MSTEETQEKRGKYFIQDYGLARMASYSNYPDALLDAMRVKSLVGRKADIWDPDVSVSAFELGPGAHYDDHAHPFPEVYVFLAGAAECRWGDEAFEARAGTVTHCPPNVPHAMRVTSDEPLRAIIMSWAPNGDRAVWQTPSTLLRPPNDN